MFRHSRTSFSPHAFEPGPGQQYGKELDFEGGDAFVVDRGGTEQGVGELELEEHLVPMLPPPWNDVSGGNDGKNE